MKNFDMVYCVECGSIVSRHQAELIFKTGFYKITIPLAHCKECAHKREQGMEIASVDPHESCSSFPDNLPALAQ